jgi:two-component system, NarL family, nitrate/nitrite response regulator NarL
MSFAKPQHVGQRSTFPPVRTAEKPRVAEDLLRLAWGARMPGSDIPMPHLAVLAPQSLARAGLTSLLTSLEFDVVAEGATLDDLIQRTAGDEHPDMLLTNPVPSAAEICDLMQGIEAWAPTTKVVFLAANLDIDLLSECFACGARGYLLDDLSAEALQKSLALVFTGEKVFPSALAPLLANSAKRVIADPLSEIQSCELSPREIEILRLLADGRSNKVIAATLNIAESTTKLHLRNIMRKLSATNRTQAA